MRGMMLGRRQFSTLLDKGKPSTRMSVNTQHPKFKAGFIRAAFMFVRNSEPYSLYDGLYEVVMARVDYHAYTEYADGEAPSGFFCTPKQRAELRYMALLSKARLLVLEERFLRKYVHDEGAMEAFNSSLGELIKKLDPPKPFHV